MRCLDAQKSSSSYLDGDLSPERSSAVRGHLRTCKACEEIFEAEALVIEAAALLEPLDPPDHLWQAVVQQVAEAEIADSQRAAWVRWLMETWRPVLGAGAVAVAALAWVVLRTSPMPALAPALGTAATVGAQQQIKTHQQQVTKEVDEADTAYQETIGTLRELLEEDRTTWTPGQARLVDAKLAGFRQQEDTALAAYPAVEFREQVYAVHRSEIAFLQSALAGRLGDVR